MMSGRILKMFLLICRTNNNQPKDENIIGSFKTLTEAKEALEKECKSKKEFLVFQSNSIAMFNSKTESWVIEIWTK